MGANSVPVSTGAHGDTIMCPRATPPRIDLMQRAFGVRIDSADHHEVLSLVLERNPEQPFAYVVTPNVDHVVRLDEQRDRLERCYQEAWLSVCDSSVLVALTRLLGTEVPLVTGSDLTAALFDRLESTDTVTVIGCEPEVVEAIKDRYGLEWIHHYNPPMGFINDEHEVQACVDFVIAHPARFVFFSVGSPQQEIFANRILHAGSALGVGFCVGSALRFLMGAETRAPNMVRGSGLEWAYRLAQDPKRLWRRYLVEGPRVFQIAASRLLSALKSTHNLTRTP
jgi:exopolysaccharide biosynthesis WecB/TagA/CpsF family protein